MYISRIFIKNFRNFRMFDAKIQEGVTCFVGENNVGKTNLFHALRLLLDGNLSAYRRRLDHEDLAKGLTFSKPEHVIISIELSGFAGIPNEEALSFTGVLANGNARLTYRFRPKPTIREQLNNLDEVDQPPELTLEDYVWEIAAGGDDIDLSSVAWDQSFGTRFSTDTLQQGYLLVFMEALRDVEARLALSRTSPLQQIIEQRNIPQPEKQQLAGHLATANISINASDTITQIGQALTASFKQAAGKSYAMGVSLGLAEPSFEDVARGLKVLLSGYGMESLDPARNGLGLNNLLYISMLLNYFENRIAERKTAGQLLLIEEPEAHLHPQLQRVFLNMLQQRKVQVFVTTHSTHVTSAVPISQHIVLSSGGGSVTEFTSPISIPGFSKADEEDLNRYLDATRSSLLYARKILLVEGPAELFLIPPMAKQVLGIDLDEEGIAVVPIYGTHFHSYAKLFGPGGIRRKCAIVADGDLAAPGTDISDDTSGPFEEEGMLDLSGLSGPYVKVFQCETTFEREMTIKGTLQMFEQAARELGATRIADKLKLANEALSRGEQISLESLKDSVLNTGVRFGKARFAQIASKHTTAVTDMPVYLREALTWLKDDAPHG